jgi:hypothetical protein
MAVAIVSFFVATPPQKKMMAHCRCLLLLKHKEEGDGSNYHCLFFFTTPQQKKMMVHCHHLLLLLKHKEEGEDMASSCRLLRCNRTT